MVQKIKTQKLLKVGNSYAISLDSEFVKQTRLDKNAQVTVVYDAEKKQAGIHVSDASAIQYSVESPKKLTEKQRRNYLSSEITPEFQQWVKRTLEEDKKAMEELANL